MRILSRFVGVVAVAAGVLSGCATFPAQVILDPARFENDSLRIEWAIAINFYRLKITNLTDAQVDIDLADSFLISVDAEARPLVAEAKKDLQTIPPKSYFVFSSEQGAVFGTDILGRFNAETEDRYPLPGGDIYAQDRLFLKAHSGETVRLYLTATVKGKRTTYDIPFKISGAIRVQQGPGETQDQASTSKPSTSPAPKTP